MKRKKNHGKLICNWVIVISILIAGLTLIHDLLIWGIIPLFSGQFYCLTYFGMFVDLSAIFILEVSIQYVEEWFN